MNHKLLHIIYLSLLSVLLSACQTSTIQSQTPLASSNYVNSMDGVPISYKKTGIHTEKTILFIHCLGCNSRYWKPQIDFFSKSHQVLTLDLAGHGLSDSDRKNFTIPSFSEDVIAVINTLQLSNIILVGQSLGGAVAVETALKLPNKINGIVTIDTFEKENQWPAKQEIEETMRPFKENFYKTSYPYTKDKFAPYTDKSLIYQISKDIALTPPDIGVSSLENFFQWIANKYQSAKKQLTTPLIHINSQQNNISNNNIIVVKTSGHFIPQEAPTKFNLALEKALATFKSQ